MGRRCNYEQRALEPDSLYDSILVNKVIKMLIKDGKGSVAERAVYSAMKTIKLKRGVDALSVLEKAIDTIKPIIELKSIRVGGGNFRVPIPVNDKRKLTLAMRWLIAGANARPDHGISESLANEIMDAADGRGGAVKKKEEVHKMAEANRAFAHFGQKFIK